MFNICSRPEIFSRGFAFALDQHMVVPTRLASGSSPALCEWLEQSGQRTAPRHGTTIVLPLADECAQDKRRAELSDRLREVDPLLLLFLNRVRRGGPAFVRRRKSSSFNQNARARGLYSPFRTSKNKRARADGRQT